MIDAVTKGTIARSVLEMENPIQRGIAIVASGSTVEQLQTYQVNAESWLFSAALVIVLLAAARAVFICAASWPRKRRRVLRSTFATKSSPKFNACPSAIMTETRPASL
jgi:hypothetical protein